MIQQEHHEQVEYALEHLGADLVWLDKQTNIPAIYHVQDPQTGDTLNTPFIRTPSTWEPTQ